MPPQILPFEFATETADAGDMATVQCAINKGDLPVQITWSLSGNIIEQQNPLGISITKVNRQISALSIDSVSAEHKGDYTCTVKNMAGTVNHTAKLFVNGRIQEQIV